MSGVDQWKIMIVDDHDMVRAGLRTYLMLEPNLMLWPKLPMAKRLFICCAMGSQEDFRISSLWT